MNSIRECGNLWQNLGDVEAGWQLLRFLQSPDLQVRSAAEEFLVQAGPRSIRLMQTAVATGTLDPAVAAQSLVTLMTAMWWDGIPGGTAEDGFQYDS